MSKTRHFKKKIIQAANVASISCLLAIGLYAGNALAQPGAVPYAGGCPTGYNQSGKYCVPRPGAGHAIRYNGGCPTGYNQSGKYCVSRSPNAHAIPYNSGCPTGYNQSGKFCVRR